MIGYDFAFYAKYLYAQQICYDYCTGFWKKSDPGSNSNLNMPKILL